MTLAITKQAALDKLDHELSTRIAKLRETCAHMSQSLLTRTEIRLVKMPSSIKQMNIMELVNSSPYARGHPNLPQKKAITKTTETNKRRASNSPIKVVKKGRVEKTGVETKKPAAKRVRKG